jgi:hypothetical protein
MLLFCPGAKISCHVDRQNSTTCKLSSEQSHMGNGWKAGRVAQVFGAQLWNRILWE